VKHADDYQLLAYTTALGVESGMLVYAAGEATGFEPAFRVAGMRRLIRTLDIDGTPARLLQRITDLGDAIQELASSRRIGPQEDEVGARYGRVFPSANSPPL